MGSIANYCRVSNTFFLPGFALTNLRAASMIVAVGVLVLLCSAYAFSEPRAGGLPRGGVGLPNGKFGLIVAPGTWHRQPEGQRSAAAPADASQGPISCRKIGKPLLGLVQTKSKKCGTVGCPPRQLHSSFYSVPSLCNSLGPRK